MLAKTYSFGLLGLEAYPIDIEIDIARGLPAVTFVGLADTEVKESKERVKSAIKNSGLSWPAERITVSLAPSNIKKEGACFDLPIALGILAASEQIDLNLIKQYYFLGELGLDGSVKPVSGVLPISMEIAKSEIRKIVVPFKNAFEAALVPGNMAYGAKTLNEIVSFIHDRQTISHTTINIQEIFGQKQIYSLDFSEVKGQYFAKRAIEIAVAGGHNILMIGPPGSGKTMLAKRIPTIMPELRLQEALEITKIHSAAGIVLGANDFIATRPFRNPHHSISDIALVGGGSIPKPGEISLAHGGVLFLDELPEFHRNALEALRQPLEDGFIRILRIAKSLDFPASFMFVAAMNPCPCGYYTDHKRICRCSTSQIAKYIGKISGPLLDRIDIHIEMPAIRYRELTDAKEAESSEIIKSRVTKARLIQNQRLKNENIFYNARMNTRLIKKHCYLTNEARDLLKMAMNELSLSARAYDKILKVSRTIADLAESEIINAAHISEAVHYRSLDRQV